MFSPKLTQVRREWVLVVSTAMLVACVALGVAHRGGIGLNGDSSPIREADPLLFELRDLDWRVAAALRSVIAPDGRLPIPFTVVDMLTGWPAWMVVVLTSAVVLWWRCSKTTAAFLMVAALSVDAAALVAKVLFHPAFPYALERNCSPAPECLSTLRVLATVYANYPSGHMARATTMLVFLLLVSPGRRPVGRAARALVASAILAAVAVGRIVEGHHDLTAVAGAALLGAGWGLLAIQLLRRRIGHG